MAKKIIFILMLSVAGVAFWSCNKDKDNGDACSIAWSTELSDEINAMSAAAQAYGQNPSYENCMAYKNAAQAYLNALKPYGNCAALTGQDRVAWQNALDQAQQSVDELDCTR